MATRTYQLEDVGLELFLRPGGRASLYLTFASPAARDAAMRQLAAQPALRLAARCPPPPLVYNVVCVATLQCVQPPNLFVPKLFARTIKQAVELLLVDVVLCYGFTLDHEAAAQQR